MPSAWMPSARWSAATDTLAERTTLAGDDARAAAVASPAAKVSDASAIAATARRISDVGTARTPLVSAPTGLAVGLALRPALRRGCGDSPREPMTSGSNGSPAPRRLDDEDSAISGCFEARTLHNRLTLSDRRPAGGALE